MAGEQGRNVQVRPSIDETEIISAHTHTYTHNMNCMIVLRCGVHDILVKLHVQCIGILSPLYAIQKTGHQLQHKNSPAFAHRISLPLQLQPSAFPLNAASVTAQLTKEEARPAGSRDRRRPCYLHWAHGELFAERDNLTVR